MVVLKWDPYVGASLDSLCVPIGFGGTAGFELNTSNVFSQGVLAAVTLVRGGAGD